MGKGGGRASLVDVRRERARETERVGWGAAVALVLCSTIQAAFYPITWESLSSRRLQSEILMPPLPLPLPLPPTASPTPRERASERESQLLEGTLARQYFMRPSRGPDCRGRPPPLTLHASAIRL